MLLDAGNAEDRQKVTGTHWDICIIGSGAAGLAMASYLLDWSKQNNKKVIVLEASRRNDRGSIVTPHHRYEDHILQPIYDGIMVESDGFTDISREGKTSREFFLASRIKAYGGTTNCWQGWTRSLDEIDFASSLDPSTKWPDIVKKELTDTFYTKAMTYCSLGNWTFPLAYNASYWPVEATHYDNPKLALLGGTDQYRLRNQVVLQIGGDRDSKKDPINHPEDGAWSFQLRWGPDIEKSDSIAICRNVNVRSLVVASGGIYWVNATTVTDSPDGPLKGDDFRVSGSRYVLATGCVENVRLILNSKLTRTELPTLGKYVMTHPLVERAASFHTPKSSRLTPEARRYYAGSQINATQFPPNVMAMLAPTPELVQDKRIGNFRTWLQFGPAEDSYGTANLCWEQKPAEGNEITLDLQANDRIFGDPLPRVKIALGETDWETQRLALSAVRDFLTDKGGNPPNPIVDYFAETHDIPKLTGEHAMGGARFGSDRDHGVVDSNCKVFNQSNLYVTGGALFPTGGWANPTLTIIALALRLAEYLKTH